MPRSMYFVKGILDGLGSASCCFSSKSFEFISCPYLVVYESSVFFRKLGFDMRFYYLTWSRIVETITWIFEVTVHIFSFPFCEVVRVLSCNILHTIRLLV